MGLYAMAQAAALNRRSTGVGAMEKERSVTPQTAIAAIAAYIPAEVIGTYLAVLSIFAPSGKSTILLWLIPNTVILEVVFLGLTAFAIWGAARLKDNQEQQKARRENRTLDALRFPSWPIGLGVVSFLVWSFAVPSSGLAAVLGWPQALAGGAILIWALIAGILGPLKAPLPD